MDAPRARAEARGGQAVGIERQVGANILDAVDDGYIATIFEESDEPPHAAKIDRIAKPCRTVARTVTSMLCETRDGRRVHADERNAALIKPMQEMTSGAAVVYGVAAPRRGLRNAVTASVDEQSLSRRCGREGKWRGVNVMVISSRCDWKHHDYAEQIGVIPLGNGLLHRPARHNPSLRKSVFDFAQGITALARAKPHQDARLELEGKAKALLDCAA